MNQPRISRFFITASFTVTICLAAMPAHADVMEIGPEGARWVVGELADAVQSQAQGQDKDALQSGFVDVHGVIVPDGIVASVESSVESSASGIPEQYAAKIAELSKRFDLSPSLLEALVWQESRWRPNAVSHAGARGLAQLMPGTARYLGVDPDDPMQNLEGGARYLREQLDRFDGDLEKALAAYNAGPGRVIRAGGIPNIRETKEYVAAIMGRLASHSRSDEPY